MLQPFGMYELFGVPTHRLTEHAVEAHALLGTGISRLYARLGEVPTFAKRVALLDHFLIKQCGLRKRQTKSQWGRALSMIACNRGAHSVQQIAASLTSSVRQLERKPLEFAGMTPQTMMRVARFSRALRLKQASDGKLSMTWTEIAYASGYYDQTHLIREFHQMGGVKPTTLADQLESHHGTALLLRSAD